MALVPRRFKLIKQGLDDGAVLADLDDVASTTPTNGQVLTWNGTSWVPADTAGPEFVTFVAQDAEPAANTLWMDDGTNYVATSLVWENPAVFLEEVSFGDPGNEQGSIPVNGATYDAIVKINEFGGGRAAALILHRHATSTASTLAFARARGTTETHSDVQSGDVLGYLDFLGWNTSSYYRACEIQVEVDGTPGVSDMPGKIVFKVSPDGSATPAAALTIHSDKEVELGVDGFITFDEHASAPGTPAAGKVSLYAKADGNLYQKDDAGTERVLYNAGGGGGASALDDLTDVDTATTTPDVGDTLVFDGTNWVPEPEIDYWALVLADSPTAAWSCNQTSGTTVTDDVGANDLTFGGSSAFVPVSLVPSIPDAYSLRLVAGGGGAASLGAALFTPPVTGDWSIELIAKLPRTSTTNNYRLVVLTASGETEATNYQFYVSVGSGPAGGGLFVFWEYGAGTNVTTSAASGATGLVPEDAPLHILVVKDGTANTLTFYLNGRSLGSTSYANEPSGGASAVLSLGDTTATYETFLISHVAVYDGTKLSAADALKRAKTSGLWGH